MVLALSRFSFPIWIHFNIKGFYCVMPKILRIELDHFASILDGSFVKLNLVVRGDFYSFAPF